MVENVFSTKFIVACFISDLTPEQVQVMDPSQVRPIQLTDFLDSLKRVRCSVPLDAIQKYEDWNKKYGDVTT